MSNPSGFCLCGCGRLTNMIKQDRPERGQYRGDYADFVRGHHGRLQEKRKPTLGVDCQLEDRGYPTECWIWTTGNIGAGGYAIVGKNMEKAHRRSYEMHVGPIPDGTILHHLCEQKTCVNPEHLQPVTRTEHVRIHQRRFSCEEARAIRASGESPKALAERFGVSSVLIWTIQTGRSYADC